MKILPYLFVAIDAVLTFVLSKVLIWMSMVSATKELTPTDLFSCKIASFMICSAACVIVYCKIEKRYEKN